MIFHQPKCELPSSQTGVTLIELMVAMVLGLLVAGGIVTVFSSTSSSNKAQTQLARLQEEGRFAIKRLGSDLGMANGLYCNNSGGVAATAASGTLLDQLRSPKVFATELVGAAPGAVSGALGDVTTTWGSGGYPAKPTVPYSMPSFLYMRGYECSLTGCTLGDPVTAGLPASGTTAGLRVRGADVLTLRYVAPDSGWSIGETGGSKLTVTGTGGSATLTSISIIPLAGEPLVSHFGGGDLAMLADCSGAQIFALGSVSGGTLTVSGGANMATGAPAVPTAQAAPRLFDVNSDFRTVTYYLQVVSANNDGNPPFTGALRRRVNGGTVNAAHGGSDDELVRGVERLDFRYGVEDTNGDTSFLSAAEVDGATNCPPQEPGALTTVGCLWRGVKSIEVSILMSGQTPLYTLSGNDLFYAYSADSNPGLLAPGGHAIKPSDQGFPDPLLRREFTALVAVRNFNP